MLRGLATVAGGTALLVAGLMGCSSGTKSPSAPSGVATASSGSVSATTGTGTAKVTIDGQVSDIKGEVVCAANGGNFTIAIGGAATGIAVIMAEDASGALAKPIERTLAAAAGPARHAQLSVLGDQPEGETGLCGGARAQNNICGLGRAELGHHRNRHGAAGDRQAGLGRRHEQVRVQVDLVQDRVALCSAHRSRVAASWAAVWLPLSTSEVKASCTRAPPATSAFIIIIASYQIV
jgi:hypothetical protein